MNCRYIVYTFPLGGYIVVSIESIQPTKDDCKDNDQQFQGNFYLVMALKK